MENNTQARQNHPVLDLPMDPEKNDAGASSVRDYLRRLAYTVWKKGDGFSGKRPFGNSSWQYELMEPLVKGEEYITEAQWETMNNAVNDFRDGK